MSTILPTSGRMTRIIVSLSTALALSGAGAMVPLVASADHTAIHTLEQSIAKLMDELAALKAQQGGGAKCTFTRDLFQGVTGDDVKCLQQSLNGAGFKVAASGAGSPGNETMFFGSLTRAAVSKWQAANGVSPTAGYFGPKSRAKYDSMVVVTPPPPPPPPPGTPPPVTPPGTGLAVAAGTQPGDSLAPLSAARIPATRFTLTASSDGDIRVNSITVERQGPATDSSVKDLVLLDEDNLQIGLARTLNSNHQATLNEKFTVKAGQTRTLTIGINRPTTGSDAGDIAKMAVVALDVGSSTVSGTLPVVGSPLTMNTTLTLGAVTLTKGVNDPGSSQTKEIGTKGYIFTSLRLTAGSAEALSLKWVSFNQSGSAAASDLKNVVLNVDGTDYAATVSSDGKYYTAKFGTGIDMAKGNIYEVYVKGDVEGGSNRGVDFDLYRYTDVYAVGKSFGFGVTPTSADDGDSQTDDDGTFDDDTNPVWDAYEATIGNGTLTVTASTAIPAQNIGVNVNEVPFGAFDVDAKGEGIAVASMVIRVSANKNDSSVTEVDYSQVSLVDKTTGKVVAGPKDGSGTTDAQMVFTFTDTVNFPIGKRTYVLKGKLSTDFDNDTLISASTTPNSDWTSITGDVSGSSITAANTGTVSGPSMTVKRAAAIIAVASTPTSQNVIRGAQGFTFANLIFDSGSSGEDVRFTSAGVQYDAAVAADLTNCQLFDGTKALNTGTNIQNPSATGDKTFTLDNNLTITKATSKTVALKCDISKSSTGDYVQWSFSSNESFGATGLTSGSSVTPGVASSSASTAKFTLTGTGTLAITLDPSSSALALAQAGQDIVISRIRLTTTNEAVDVKQLALALTNTASNTPADLVKLTLWDGATKVGEVTATSSDTGLIVSTTNLQVSKDSDKIIDVKAQLAPIGNNEAGRPGHLVSVDWDNVSENGTQVSYGVGVQSSDNVRPTSADTASNGVRVVRAYPTVTQISPSSTSLADASQKTLYQFSVAAPTGTNGVSLYKFTFNVATTGDDSGYNDVTITNLRLYAYSNSNFSGAKYSPDGLLNNGSTLQTSEGGNDGIDTVRATSTDYVIFFNPASPTSAAPEAIAVSGSETVYFQLRGDVSGADAGDSAVVQLMGDNAWYGIGNTSGGTLTYDDAGFLAGSITYGFATSAPILASGSSAGSAGENVGATGGNTSASGAGADFIWSGNSTTTHSGAAGNSGPDWYNGFLVPGLPSGGSPSVTFTL